MGLACLRHSSCLQTESALFQAFLSEIPARNRRCDGMSAAAAPIAVPEKPRQS
ncbi:hypothetical protein SCH4B_3501 [Ruegeria sp. TrichCH4B]|nr:hypothetical protein SCH4B_3501 [Ruegeria sp. TrichCH4B]